MKISSKDKSFDLPRDYVISKFYELGYKVSHNKYNDTYNGCCPVCREGKSWGKKKRCFYLPEKDLIYCHNGDCGWSSKPYKWIREVSKMSDKEIRKEIEDSSFDILESVVVPLERRIVPSLPEDSINLFDKTQCAFYEKDGRVKAVLEYVRERRLDTAKNRPDAFYLSLKDYSHKNRLVIPFKDEKGKIIFYQSRKVFDWDENAKYTSKIDAVKAICGIDKVSEDLDTVFLFEGPIDSFFVRNGLGLAGINVARQQYTPKQEEQMESLRFYQKVWVLDSQWLDETSREKTQILIDQGESVFIWPENFGKKFKDLCEMCVHHKIDEVSPEFIKKNTSKGISASVRLKLLNTKLDRED